MLKLLASDFGQNELTPYGIVSFAPLYLSECITDVSGFCETVFKKETSVLSRTLCETFLEANRRRRRRILQDDGTTCPFHVTDANPNLSIDDVGFFNLIGSLGTFSLSSSQCLVLYYDLPVGSLPLDYWSFNLYLADRLSDDVCKPYRQTYLASLAPPLNCFMTPSIANKKFNPLTGQGDVVSPTRLRFSILVSLNPAITTSVKESLMSKKDMLPFDFIHVFGVPTGEGSMVLDSSFPNPNGMTEQTAMFNPETDRLSLFLRLSPDPQRPEEMALRNFTRFQDPFDKNFCQVCLVDLMDSKVKQETYYPYVQPTYITTVVNEKERLGERFTDILDSFRSFMYRSSFSWSRLPLRNSILNIFAPLYSSVLNTTKPYLGGWQAIQLAGIAQGDNPDTQYRLSGVVCLSSTDVMVAVATNHARLDNCLYNNINIVDVNKAYSIASITLTRETTEAEVYMVVAGRDKAMVDRVMKTVRPLNIPCFPVYILTAPSIDNGVPMCHQLVMIERVYVNMQYPSSSNAPSSTVVHNLHTVFGENLRDVMYDAPDDAWKSLTNVVAPRLDTLIAPVFYKVGGTSYRKTIVKVSVAMFVVMTMVMILLTFRHRRS